MRYPRSDAPLLIGRSDIRIARSLPTVSDDADILYPDLLDRLTRHFAQSQINGWSEDTPALSMMIERRIDAALRHSGASAGVGGPQSALRAHLSKRLHSTYSALCEQVEQEASEAERNRRSALHGLSGDRAALRAFLMALEAGLVAEGVREQRRAHLPYDGEPGGRAEAALMLAWLVRGRHLERAGEIPLGRRLGDPVPRSAWRGRPLVRDFYYRTEYELVRLLERSWHDPQARRALRSARAQASAFRMAADVCTDRHTAQVIQRELRGREQHVVAAHEAVEHARAERAQARRAHGPWGDEIDRVWDGVQTGECADAEIEALTAHRRADPITLEQAERYVVLVHEPVAQYYWNYWAGVWRTERTPAQPEDSDPSP